MGGVGVDLEEGVGRRCTMEMFKNLIVWQKAMELVRAVYALTYT